MSLARWQPLNELRRMREDMDTLFERMAMPGLLAPIEMARPFPAVDVYEKDNDVMVRAEVPGLKKDDIQVTASEDAITLQGEFKQEEQAKEQGYIRHELRSGKFFRTLPMPTAIKPDQVKASFHDGVLEITAPKATQEQAKEKKVEIQG